MPTVIYLITYQGNRRKNMRLCLQTELLARNPAQKGDRAVASPPLLCMVSAQQFCLQAKAHIFCVDFPSN